MDMVTKNTSCSARDRVNIKLPGDRQISFCPAGARRKGRQLWHKFFECVHDGKNLVSRGRTLASTKLVSGSSFGAARAAAFAMTTATVVCSSADRGEADPSCSARANSAIVKHASPIAKIRGARCTSGTLYLALMRRRQASGGGDAARVRINDCRRDSPAHSQAQCSGNRSLALPAERWVPQETQRPGIRAIWRHLRLPIGADGSGRRRDGSGRRRASRCCGRRRQQNQCRQQPHLRVESRA